MTQVLVALIALALTGCAGPKPPAPASIMPSADAAAAPPAGPAAPPVTAVPAPDATAAPAPPSAAPPSDPGPPAPPPAAPEPGSPARVLYVKTHLANFRAGAGTSMKILRVLRQGARLEVLEVRHTWLRVRLDDGQEGWVAESVTSVTAPVTPALAPPGRPDPKPLAGPRARPGPFAGLTARPAGW